MGAMTDPRFSLWGHKKEDESPLPIAGCPGSLSERSDLGHLTWRVHKTLNNMLSGDRFGALCRKRHKIIHRGLTTLI
jgi:hypothetical protein